MTAQMEKLLSELKSVLAQWERDDSHKGNKEKWKHEGYISGLSIAIEIAERVAKEE